MFATTSGLRRTLMVLATLAFGLCFLAPAVSAKTIQPANPNPNANPDPPGNLLLNGSFQTGDLTDWSLTGNTGFTGVVASGFDNYTDEDSDGNFFALGAIGSDAILSQTFSDSRGASYVFSFWYNANGTAPSDFSAYFDGVQLLSLTNPFTANGWTFYSFSVTGTGTDKVQFDGYNSPDYDALDNVGVAPAAEPSSMVLLAVVLVGLAGMLARKNSSLA